MTERKPPEISFRTWIDQQISEAAERGAFDNLPGAGKPLPPQRNHDDGQVWALEWARREGLSTEEMLPAPLKLRKQAARLAETVHELRSEQDVRDAVAELNERIMEWRRIPVGPPIFVPLVDADTMLAAWHEARPPAVPVISTAAGIAPARRRWWRRRSRPA